MYSLISDPYLAGVLAFSREIHDFESNLIDSYAQELNPDAQTGHVFCTLNFVIDSEAFFSLRGEGRDPVAATFTVRAPFDHVGFSAEKNANWEKVIRVEWFDDCISIHDPTIGTFSMPPPKVVRKLEAKM